MGKFAPPVFSVVLKLKLLTLPEMPVKYWRQPSGARTGLSHSYWRILILHELAAEFWSVTMDNVEGKLDMGE